jgi:FkbM family methyltransferase
MPLPARRPTQGQQLEEPIRDTGVSHFPVSAAFEPPFVIMVDLIGHGDVQAGADVSALISNWGTWQPALAPTRKPSVVEALVGSLGGHKRRSLLVDVGAGHGFFSLAAAARGHRVHAFELSNSSRAALQASVKYNGFESLVTVHPLALGASNSSICLQPAGRAASVHQQRGYGDPALLMANNSSGCGEFGRRSTLVAALDNITDVGAMRISTNGHEGWVVEGAVPYLTTHPPAVIYLEFAPNLMRKANYSDPARLLELLYSLGYQDIAHAGYVCDERWYNITSELRSQASFSSSAQEALQQPTWCKLRPEQFHLLVAQAHDEVPENVLLVYKHSGASQEEARSRAAGQQQQQAGNGSSSSSDGSGQPPPGLAAPVLQEQQQRQVAGTGGGSSGSSRVWGGGGGAPTAEAAAAGRSVAQLGSSTAQAASNFLHGTSGPRSREGSATADGSSSSSSSRPRDLGPGSGAL